MGDEAIRPPSDQRRAWQSDDPGRPAGPEGGDHPDPACLEQNEDGEQGKVDRPVPRERPQPQEPGPVQEDDEDVVVRARLDGALGAQTVSVILGQNQFPEPLRGHQGEDDEGLHPPPPSGSRC